MEMGPAHGILQYAPLLLVPAGLFGLVAAAALRSPRVMTAALLMLVTPALFTFGVYASGLISLRELEPTAAVAFDHHQRLGLLAFALTGATGIAAATALVLARWRRRTPPRFVIAAALLAVLASLALIWASNAARELTTPTATPTSTRSAPLAATHAHGQR